MKGYDVGAQFVTGDQVLYRINHGGQNVEYGPNVLATGASASKLSEVVREHFPLHRVSRIDSCEDYHHPDVYDYLRKKALRIAKEQKVKVLEMGSPLSECDTGRTLYVGSKTSAVLMRIYEKGKQLGCGEDWVRAELQVRPQKAVKQIASQLSALEVWGLSKWSHAMAKAMGNAELQRVDAEVYQQSDHDRAYRFMLKQYRRVLEQMLATHGSPETVGAQIFRDLEDIAIPPPKASLKPV
jgi:DNA relaxase NicK